MSELTERQKKFLVEVEKNHQGINWQVSSYPKVFAPDWKPETNWPAFKTLLLDICLGNGLFFLETNQFFHIGRNNNCCQYAENELTKFLESKGAPQKAAATQATSLN